MSQMLPFISESSWRRLKRFPGSRVIAFQAADGSPQIPAQLMAIGWNQQVLTFADFEKIARRERVLVGLVPTRVLAGAFMVRRGWPVIILQESLRGAARSFIAFHELGHYFLHDPHLPADCGQRELEADLVAYGALIPQHLVRSCSVGEIVNKYGYPRQMVTARIEMLRCFGL